MSGMMTDAFGALFLVVGGLAVLYLAVRVASAAYFNSKKHYLKEIGYGIQVQEKS